ncbi:MAG: MaoC family dehydratase N-terminal domain-containing protein [Nitriliruptorales bacterium]|nr:MaoC family dehydratase N-terminal domain-containing protein [Nitriliruptorales bacterium]
MSDPIVEAVEAVIAAGEGEPLVAPDVVNEPMIRHWVDAFGDTNPAWLDASQSPFGAITAPPAMLGVWTMETPRNDGGPRDQALRAVEEGGFTSVVATDYSQEFLKPLTLGTRITETRSIEWIEGPKETGLGTGYFVGTRYDYVDQEGELVGTARMKLLKFKPKARS